MDRRRVPDRLDHRRSHAAHLIQVTRYADEKISLIQGNDRHESAPMVEPVHGSADRVNGDKRDGDGADRVKSAPMVKAAPMVESFRSCAAALRGLCAVKERCGTATLPGKLPLLRLVVFSYP